MKGVVININKNNIKNFIEYGSEKINPIDLLTHMIFTFIFLAFISTIYGVVGKGIVLYISLAIDMLTLLYIVCVILIRKRLMIISHKEKFMIAGSFSLFSSVYFIVFANLIMSISESSNLLYRLIMVLGLVFILLIYFVITIIRINNGDFQNKKRVKKDNITFFSIMGGVAGISLTRMLSVSLNQETAINIAILCIFVIAMALSFGTINFLKYYFMKKYSIELAPIVNEQELKTISQKNCKGKLTPIKKIIYTFISIVILIFIVLFIIGVMH